MTVEQTQVIASKMADLQRLLYFYADHTPPAWAMVRMRTYQLIMDVQSFVEYLDTQIKA